MPSGDNAGGPSRVTTTRVLAHIHTFNDADVIERTVETVRHQTRPPDAIILVDNASTDGTLDREFPKEIAVIRNSVNLGTSGAIAISFKYGLEHGFDWVWILDADSVPEPDALEKLLELYASWPKAMQDQTGLLACLVRNQPDGRPSHGHIFTPHGRALVTPPREPRYYSCHVTIWSGSLYRTKAVRLIGLPNADYVLDRGELEYTYRLMKGGYKAFIHQDAVIQHNIRGALIKKEQFGPKALKVGPITLGSIERSLIRPKAMKAGPRAFRFGPVTLAWLESPPIRCYYVCRNTLYFTLYDLAIGRFARLRELWRVRSRPGRSLMSGIAWQTALFTLNFAVRPHSHRAEVRACLRGIWHGLTGNIAARY